MPTESFEEFVEESGAKEKKWLAGKRERENE
jgi:hypothetical protein